MSMGTDGPRAMIAATVTTPTIGATAPSDTIAISMDAGMPISKIADITDASRFADHTMIDTTSATIDGIENTASIATSTTSDITNPNARSQDHGFDHQVCAHVR